MKKTKTVESWLKELPESIRPEPIHIFLNERVEYLSEAVLRCYWSDEFINNSIWDDSSKWDFYASLYQTLKWAEEG